MTFALNPFRVSSRAPHDDRWSAVVAIMAGIFAIVTAEILPIGLLLPIASEFGVTPGVSGAMMAIPGLVAAAAAPLATVATARTDRRAMLVVWMAVLTGSNLISAIATDYWMILAARVLVGVVIGGFWSIGAGLAGRLVAGGRVARATSTIFLAVPLGSVLGVPLGTYVADIAGWRSAFMTLTGLSGAVLIALACTVPALPAADVTRLSVLGRLLRGRDIRIGLLVTFLVVLAHFGTYTYVSAFLADVAGLGLGSVSALLLVYGAAGLVGNVVAGTAMARNLSATFGVAAALIALATLLLPVIGAHVTGALVLLVLWGLGYGAVPACSQTWLARAAGGADEAASVLFTSSFQATISTGALLGGVVIDGASSSVLMLAGGAVATVAAVIVGSLGSRR